MDLLIARAPAAVAQGVTHTQLTHDLHTRLKYTHTHTHTNTRLTHTNTNTHTTLSNL